MGSYHGHRWITWFHVRAADAAQRINSPGLESIPRVTSWNSTFQAWTSLDGSRVVLCKWTQGTGSGWQRYGGRIFLSLHTLEMWKEIWAWMKETASCGFLRGAALLRLRSLDLKTKSSRIEGTWIYKSALFPYNIKNLGSHFLSVLLGRSQSASLRHPLLYGSLFGPLGTRQGLVFADALVSSLHLWPTRHIP